MDIAAIPTFFKGVRYRSRLEANWAAFFHLAHWRFQYERLDFYGWIPDFVLLGAKQKIWVEIKPALTYGDLLQSEDCNKACDVMEGEQLHADDEVLLLGARIFPESETGLWAGDTLGVLGGVYYDDDKRAGVSWDAAALSWDKEDCILDFHHVTQSFTHRISGNYDGDHHLHPVEGGAVAQRNWLEAKNMVQWKGASS